MKVTFIQNSTITALNSSGTSADGGSTIPDWWWWSDWSANTTTKLSGKPPTIMGSHRCKESNWWTHLWPSKPPDSQTACGRTVTVSCDSLFSCNCGSKVSTNIWCLRWVMYVWRHHGILTEDKIQKDPDDKPKGSRVRGQWILGRPGHVWAVQQKWLRKTRSLERSIVCWRYSSLQ